MIRLRKTNRFLEPKRISNYLRYLPGMPLSPGMPPKPASPCSPVNGDLVKVEIKLYVEKKLEQVLNCCSKSLIFKTFYLEFEFNEVLFKLL
jgi:hypothetical protein